MPFGQSFNSAVARFDDPLAEALWSARLSATRVDDGWNGLSRDRAGRVARELYSAMEQAGDRRVGWKLAVTDRRTQERLDASAPFCAPLFEGSLLASPARISLADFVAPLLEAEIGLVITDAGPVPVACVEVIDSRISAGSLSVAWAMADFGLQGCMLFGDGATPAKLSAGTVAATVSVDDRQVASANGDLAAAVNAIRAVSTAHGPAALAAGTRVATGSLIEPVPLQEGAWSVDFGPLGRLSMEVGP